jgi:transcriptional regulator with XRE-family HTH domain
MSPLSELSSAVRTRRSDIGLTQMALATLSGLSRATVNQVEKGTIKDLSLTRAARLLEALGLSMAIATPRPRPAGSGREKAKSEALDIAARTASVSYRTPISAAQLREALMSGLPASAFLPHVYALLDEAPVSLLASVVEQLHWETGVERAQVWKRMRELAHNLKSSREFWR